jgi:anti-anti-sigma regulatory factor
MNQAKVNFLIIQNKENKIGVSFNNSDQLTKNNMGVIRHYLTELISKPGTSLEIDLTGIHFIDNTGYDTLNLISRIGKNYGSSISLKGVGTEIYEIINLFKKYYVFDVKDINAAYSL